MRKNNSRFLWMLLLGIVIFFLLNHVLKPVKIEHNELVDLLLCLFITAAVWEGNLRLDHWVNNRFPWVESPAKRVVVQLPLSILYTGLMIYLSLITFNRYVCPLSDDIKDTFIAISVIMGIVICVTILSIEIGVQFFGNWKTSLVEVERYKTESLQAQLQNLKNQINPHFLFNNMSVLSSLVYKDQDKAVDFINRLSKVYRYLLDNKDRELVTLEEELTFINSYTYLLKIRFDTNIHFAIDVEKEALIKLVPPMALQILVENAIKHNEISEEQQLTVRISTAGTMLQVSNNLQIRTSSEPGSKTGLKNICDRYHYFTEVPVEIIENGQHFIVKIPLLHNR